MPLQRAAMRLQLVSSTRAWPEWLGQPARCALLVSQKASAAADHHHHRRRQHVTVHFACLGLTLASYKLCPLLRQL